jgi:hypothetical protein
MHRRRRSSRTLLYILVGLWWLGRRAASSPAPAASSRPEPAPPTPPQATPGEVPAVLTPTNAAAVAGAIVRAYQRLKGRMPTVASAWLWPLAVSSLETAGWTQLYNWNVGNVKAASGPWFANPHVTGAGNRFADCADLDAGALLMLRSIDGHGGLAAADQGDAAAFQAAMDRYLGSGTYPNLAALAASLAATVPAS